MTTPATPRTITVEALRIAMNAMGYQHNVEEVFALLPAEPADEEHYFEEKYNDLWAAVRKGRAEPAGAGLREAELDALRDGLQRCSERVVALLAAEKKTR